MSHELFEIVAQVCRTELSDPRIRGVQLTGAEMTDDLQILKIFYYIEGTEEEKKNLAKGLNSSVGYLKRAIAGRVDIRVIPDIKFFFDEGIGHAEKMDRLIKELKKDGGMGSDGGSGGK